mmetsp:Transcript_13815/g.41761  ORF Transcript_13815/g.41761 Transcript_13815/m.41761 type:complete len:127 (+) Transcript_13815:2133-2513(+)
MLRATQQAAWAQQRWCMQSICNQARPCQQDRPNRTPSVLTWCKKPHSGVHSRADTPRLTPAQSSTPAQHSSLEAPRGPLLTWVIAFAITDAPAAIKLWSKPDQVVIRSHRDRLQSDKSSSGASLCQ